MKTDVASVDALRTELDMRVRLIQEDVEAARSERTYPGLGDGIYFPSAFPSNVLGSNCSFSFRPTIDSAGTGIEIETGDVVLGPMKWIEWGSITDASTTPSVSSTNTHVWLEINVATPSASMVVGSKADMMAALDSTEDDNTMVYPLVETTWESGKITKAKRLLDAIIPRAAG